MTLESTEFLFLAYIHFSYLLFVVSNHHHVRISNAFGRTTPVSVS
jgi:hypothetical protein